MNASARAAEERLGFVGLGTMGAPMARRLASAGLALHLYDTNEAAARALEAETRGSVAATLAEIGERCTIVILMLPDASVVRDVVLGPGESGAGVLSALAAGAVVVDMSSSYPLATRTLGETLEEHGVTLLDAPVSGGVRKAVSGELAIMLGGENGAAMARVTPYLETMGRVHRTGALGSGHATKALNNYVSACGLAAACEAVLVGRRFGLDPERMIDVINVSTGRNNSTENKLKAFVLSGDFARAGFSMALMAKDVKAAADLADELGVTLPGLGDAASLWGTASRTLGTGADHTEIFRYLEGLGDDG